MAGCLSIAVLAAAQLSTAAPAAANTIIFIDDSIDIEIAARFNAFKRFNTLNATILNNGPVHSLSRVIANASVSPITLFSRQRILHQQGTLQDNDVLVINSGAIDPAIAINAQITNQNNIEFLSFADDSNIDAGIATVSLGQRLTHYQDHLLANAVIVRNSGALTAGQTGIAAGITNRNFSQFFTDALNNNTHLGALTVDLEQSITVRQRSRIANVLSVTNRGAIDAGANGIQAEILNSNIALFRNRASTRNVSNGIIGRNLSQSLTRTNRTEIGNAIAIDNTGDIDAGTIGIGAAIETSDLPELQNTTFDSNSNTEDLSRNISQSLDIGQAHEIGSALVIQNAGDVKAGGAALAAEIANNDIDRIENTFRSAHINDNSGNAGRGLTQSLAYDQSNLIDNAAVISNSGALSSGGGYAIAVSVENTDFGLIANRTDQTNQNSGNTARNLTQTSSSSQYNGITNLVAIENTGAIRAGQGGIAVAVETDNILLSNIADITNANSGGSVGGNLAQSIDLEQTNAVETSVLISNTGKIDAGQIGIAAEIENGGMRLTNDATLTLSNAASVSGSASQSLNVAQTNRVTSEIVIANSGEVNGGRRGIYAAIEEPSLATTNTVTPSTSLSGATVNTSAQNVVEASIDIENTGSITADNLFAIETEGASTTIYNHGGGTITGYVNLSDKADRFENGPGGTFFARRTSDFGAGNDIFVNQSGGVVQAAMDRTTREATSLINLDRVVNRGEITIVDGGTGDVLTLSADRGGDGVTYIGQGGAKLGMDVFLNDDGSSRDKLMIEGTVLGRTRLVVNNTNLNSGVFNPDGIPIIFATGKTPDALGFHMDEPVDAGFFDYDLFFVPTGSGYWELKSFAGGGARMLPQLMTAAQDAFHITNQTWFDRSADLRVLLHRQQSGAHAQAGQNYGYGAGDPGADQPFVPALWVKGGGAWMEQEDSDTARAYGRTYEYNLNRDLNVADMQIGLDFGTENVLSDGDMVIFGLLGGVNLGELDYHAINREFDLKGGEFGAYATYLKGNLFVDTLLKGQYLSYDANGARGFPDSFDSISWGGRTDAGYRFGGYSRGLFVEPLATLALAWTDLEDLSNGGNTVDFKDNESVRGRLGLRVGTTYEVWENTIVEPFVIGSYWKDFTDSNETTLVSVGQTFDFYDSVADGWGEVSAGLNLFNPDANTAVFAKADFIFGDEVDGVAGRTGIRVNW
ncbi:autotransporter outer membrane beta-barrel domain-containing protein [Methyloligella halotolerans]|uniref:autotransporter outer membrane beta-barrel domain-containing protein n=1 Tax=Methyloligella halotolerans TaxID=1177755 RepID=UPI00083DB4D8|nr:autotransporter outer membrane beta-barrel domain-containing protein [Methyloligella halotolerans]